MDIGIKTADECVTEFQSMKMSKGYRFITYKLNPEFTQVVIDTKGARDSTWDDFVKSLPKAENRYVVFDFKFVTNDKPPRELEKIIFVNWSPDDAPTKLKTVYATNKEHFKASLQTSKEFQATDLSDLDQKLIEETLKK